MIATVEASTTTLSTSPENNAEMVDAALAASETESWFADGSSWFGSLTLCGSRVGYSVAAADLTLSKFSVRLFGWGSETEARSILEERDPDRRRELAAYRRNCADSDSDEPRVQLPSPAFAATYKSNPFDSLWSALLTMLDEAPGE
jgi:hypothetical protein